ncbi:aldo/keto reductase [Nocardiopsis halophila]|uniref:aldo/keto reductase n=1 Tax=Nocardiopsis halophila TaxID=141692 RepID=UPI00034D9083|nr:aldo/keto reductase [Nocardiopsis halophila]
MSATPGTFTIADRAFPRMGFGAMHMSGDRCWGPPADVPNALAVARRAVGLGVRFIDTADSYGPGIAEELLAEALHPYPEDAIIATKAGQSRPSAGEWKPLGRPEYLRQQAELSLRRLRVERIDLFQLHRIDPQVPLEEQMGALAQLQREGKVGAIGLSEVSVEQIEAARREAEVVSVQNRYNLADRASEKVLDHCEREGIAFIPYEPLDSGDLGRAGGPVAEIAEETGASSAQICLAWLLHRSPVVVPIPGTSSVRHLEDNVAAARVDLTPAHVARLTEEGR